MILPAEFTIEWEGSLILLSARLPEPAGANPVYGPGVPVFASWHGDERLTNEVIYLGTEWPTVATRVLRWARESRPWKER